MKTIVERYFEINKLADDRIKSFLKRNITYNNVSSEDRTRVANGVMHDILNNYRSSPPLTDTGWLEAFKEDFPEKYKELTEPEPKVISLPKVTEAETFNPSDKLEGRYKTAPTIKELITKYKGF